MEDNLRPHIDGLCAAFALLVIHMNESWPTFEEDITTELNGSVEHATCLFLILKHMASECDNDNIVI